MRSTPVVGRGRRAVVLGVRGGANTEEGSSDDVSVDEFGDLLDDDDDKEDDGYGVDESDCDDDSGGDDDASDVDSDYSDEFESPIMQNRLYNPAKSNHTVFVSRVLPVLNSVSSKRRLLVVLFLVIAASRALSVSDFVNMTWLLLMLRRSLMGHVDVDGYLSGLFGTKRGEPRIIRPDLYDAKQMFLFENLNKAHEKDYAALKCTITDTKTIRMNATLDASPSLDHPSLTDASLAIVYDFKADSSVSNLDELRSAVSAILRSHKLLNNNSTTEVVLRLESPGGEVSAYGLAAQQLARLNAEPSIILSIFADRVAASGGYMLATHASPNRLFATPFAYVGSVGVVASILNFHSLLTDKGVNPLTFVAGDEKQPISQFSEITEVGREKTQESLREVHEEFMSLVSRKRPGVDMTTVGGGKVFLGGKAKELHLVDHLMSSDEYIDVLVGSGRKTVRMEKKVSRPSLFGDTLNSVEAKVVSAFRNLAASLPAVSHSMVYSPAKNT